MYLKEYFPFYTTYANPLLYEGERMQDKEFNLMKSYYPGDCTAYSGENRRGM